MHKLLLSNNVLETDYVYGSAFAWVSQGSEYALIYMNIFNCARILNMPESAET